MPLRHIVMFNNCLFLYVHLQNLLPKKFKNHFSLTSEQHQYLTRGTRINIPTIKTTKYGSYSLTLKAIKQWNTIQNSLKFDTNHPGLTRPKFQNLIINYINSLWSKTLQIKEPKKYKASYNTSHSKTNYSHHVCFPFSALLFFHSLFLSLSLFFFFPLLISFCNILPMIHLLGSS